ncbi:MAG TPA: toll/interleukin-1 receptor domain-containing protein [Ktedonobacterales bacterium]|jgi:tetratricopeptide (TPR) repeat protein
MPESQTMGQLRIFLSHAAPDQPFAETLVGALRQAGADVWYAEDPSIDEPFPVGVPLQLPEPVIRELVARPVFVVVLSPEAFAAANVEHECRWALHLYRRAPGRVILPVVARAVTQTDFGILRPLANFPRIQAPDSHPHPEAEAIVRTLHMLAPTSADAVDDDETFPDAAQPEQPQPDPRRRAVALLTQGNVLMSTDRYAEAIPFFARATQLAPDSALAWGALGWSYGEMKRDEDSVAACERAIALDPDIAWIWNVMAAALRRLKRFEEAVAAFERAAAAFERAVVLDPNLSGAWVGKGGALRDVGRPAEALTAFQHALDLNASKVTAWIGKGSALHDLQRSDEAVSAFERALALDPNDAAAWIGMGNTLTTLAGGNRDDILYALARYEEALAAHDRALALDSDSVYAWTGKGNTLYALARYREALAAYERALALEQSAIPWNNKGSALLVLGCRDEALAAFDQALALDPTYGDALANKVRALHDLGHGGSNWRL